MKNSWLIEWLPDPQSAWAPFGLPHTLDEAEERFKELEKKFPEAHWRIVPVVDKVIAKS